MEKTYQNIKNLLISSALLFVVFSILPAAAEAANLYFSPSSGNYSQGENFTASILVNADKPINAVSGTVTFPTEYLEVLAISTVNSLVNLWVQNPSFSNDGGGVGNISFEGIILNPGYVGSQGRIIDIVFGVKKVGSANLVFKEMSILANDGEGTNIALSPGSATFTLIKSQSPTSQETNNSVLEKRVKEIERIIKATTGLSPAPIVVVQKLQPPGGILRFWEVLPNWIKVGVLLFIGIAIFILLLVLISFGVIVLIWLWGHTRQNGVLVIRRLIRRLANIFRRLFVYLGFVEKEIKGDVAYSVHELEKDFRSAKETSSLGALIATSWLSLSRIIKRFFTKNENGVLQKDEEKQRSPVGSLSKKKKPLNNSKKT